MFNFLTRKNKSPEEKFWDWFLKNKNGLEKFISSEIYDYSLYNKLTHNLQKYNSNLFPELTMTENDEFVFIITPDGIPNGVLPTQKLYDKKPEISNWIIEKFRQPTNEIGLDFSGIEYSTSDIKIEHYVDYEREKVDIRLFIKEFEKTDKRYETLGWLYIDHILGEYNTITKVGSVLFEQWKSNDEHKDLLSLLELRKIIDKELYKAST